MGNVATFAAGAKAVAGSSIAALHNATSLFFYKRMKVDAILNLGAFASVGLGQVDDGTNANARAYVYASDNNGPKGISYVLGGNNGGVSTGFIPLASWPAAGTYIVIYIGYNKAADQRVFGIFDGSGTNTLLDGLAKGTSIWWGTSSYNTSIQSHTNDGIVTAAACQTASAGSQVVDAEAWYTGPRASGQEDAEPSISESTLAGAWFYDDTIGSTSFADLVSGGPSLVASGTVTLSAGGTVGPTTSTPTTVIATPNSLQINLPAGNTATSALETEDQNGSVMAGRTWAIDSTPNAAVATASITGSTLTVTSVATGTTSLTVKDTASGGTSATEATVNITVGTEYDWVSANTSLATAGTGAATETITDPSANTAGGQTTVTITRHGTSAQTVITVNTPSSSQGGSGSPNEPTGMTVGMNTGSLTQHPSLVQGGTWNVGTTLISQFTQFSPTTKDSTGNWAGNIALCPDGPGYRMTYDPTLTGGVSPVRWGSPISMPSSPAGIVYYAWYMRYVNWLITGADAAAAHKLWQPRTNGSDTNHIAIAQSDNGSGIYQHYFGLGLQGPGSNSARVPSPQIPNLWNGTTIYQKGACVKVTGSGTQYFCILSNTNQQPPNATYWTAYTPAFSLAQFTNAIIPRDGNWHHMEMLLTQDNPAGSGNGKANFWIDGTQCFPTDVEGLNIISAADAPGAPYWMFDPVWGGTGASPTQTQYYDVDRLYCSQK